MRPVTMDHRSAERNLGRPHPPEEAMPQAMPMNCEANDELRQVRFDLEFEGAIRKASISYEKLARLFTAPRQDAAMKDARESRQMLVGHSKQVARLAIERLQQGMRDAALIVIS
jgi:hypothetical protein